MRLTGTSWDCRLNIFCEKVREEGRTLFLMMTTKICVVAAYCALPLVAAVATKLSVGDTCVCEMSLYFMFQNRFMFDD